MSEREVSPTGPLERHGGSPRILVIRSGAIGDTLMVTPLLRALRSSFPDAYIEALTSQTALDILRHNPHIDEVFALRHRHLPVFLSAEKRRLLRYFRKIGIDTVLSLETHRDFTSFACRLKPRRLVTYDKEAGCGDVFRPTIDAGKHSAEMHLRAGAEIGAAAAGLETELYYPAGLNAVVASRLSEAGIESGDTLIGIHAGWGGRNQHPEDTRLRSWPASRFSKLIDRIGGSVNAKFILTGAKVDRKLNDIIAAATKMMVFNAADRFSLLESAALINRMRLYITVDSGPAHIAAAVGTPLVTLWGPGILTATRPLPGKDTVRILRSPPTCAPCYGTDYMKLCTDNICMKNLEVKAVFEEVERELSTSR